MPGHMPDPVGMGLRMGEGGSWVCGVRNPPSAQPGWTLGTVALQTLEEEGKGMGKPQPYSGDSGLLSFCVSPSPFLEAESPLRGLVRWELQLLEARGDQKKAGSLKGPVGNPQGIAYLAGAGRHQEELVIHSISIYYKVNRYTRIYGLN